MYRVTTNIYESSDLVSQYLDLHFGSEVLTPFANEHFSGLDSALYFPQRCAQELIRTARKASVPFDSVLDLGCAVGGSSFALSVDFNRVVGIDLSQGFIGAAQELQKRGVIAYQRKVQGKISQDVEARIVPENARLDRVQFQVGDACQLPDELTKFNAVLMANLLCRVPEPRACMEALWKNSVIAPGGLLALVSPYSWLPEYTPEQKWLGGSESRRSEEMVQSLLSSHFNLLEDKQMPLVIREHERKFQLIISHLTIWQLK